MSKKPTVGLGLLSWRSHKTLIKTLESYQRIDLLSVFDEAVIYFSDISDEDRKIAGEFGFKAVGGENKGIAVGTENLAKALSTDYILIVQNDNAVVESLDFVGSHLEEAISLLETNRAQLVRMRHRWQVGEGFSDVLKYLRFFPLAKIDENFIPSEHGVDESRHSDSLKKKILRLLRPFTANKMRGRGLFIEKFPNEVFPNVISKIGNFFIVDSSVINFSDQCFLTSREFFIDVLMKYVNEHPSKRNLNGFQVPEICLNSRWWRQSHFKIAQGRGVFTHDRFDGSFRRNHHAFERDN